MASALTNVSSTSAWVDYESITGLKPGWVIRVIRVIFEYGSSGSNLVYKISGSDLKSALNHMH